MDCARFLVAESMNTKIPLPTIYVHSANPIGSANMIGYINNYFKNCKLPASIQYNRPVRHKVYKIWPSFFNVSSSNPLTIYSVQFVLKMQITIKTNNF